MKKNSSNRQQLSLGKKKRETQKAWESAHPRRSKIPSGVELEPVESGGSERAESHRSKPEWEEAASDSGHRSRTPVILTMALLAVIFMGGWWLTSSRKTEAAEPRLAQPAAQLDKALPKIPPREVAKNFALSGDVEERLKWVRNPEAVAGRLASYTVEARETAALKVIPRDFVTVNSLLGVTFSAQLPNGSFRFIYVLETPEGHKVDWDAYARYGTASWDAILSGEVREAKVRVLVAGGTYYNHEFEDDKLWQSFRFKSPDLDTSLHAYCALDSAAYTQLKSALGAGMRRLTLSIRAVGDSFQMRQFEITSVDSPAWVEFD